MLYIVYNFRMNNRKNLLIGFLVVMIVVVVFVGWKLSNSSSSTDNDFLSAAIVPVDDPIDVTMSFYTPWLEALLSTTTTPYESDLLSSPLISENLRERLKSEVGVSGLQVDSVLCQVVVPEKIGAKIIYTNGTEAQVMVIPRRSDASESALVTLTAIDGKWIISDIICSGGEIAPVREFDFDHEGFLLKQSVVPPLDPNNWHLVFTQNGQHGHTAPIFFNEASKCVSVDGTESVCNQDQITEATKAIIKGDMTEAGVSLRRLEFTQ